MPNSATFYSLSPAPKTPIMRGLFGRGGRQPIQNEITRMLQLNPRCPLENILDSTDLSSSIRSELPELISYFQDPEPLLNDPNSFSPLDRLIAWALTFHNVSQDPKTQLDAQSGIDFEQQQIKSYHISSEFCYMRNSSLVLSARSNAFQSFFVSNGSLIKALMFFPEKQCTEEGVIHDPKAHQNEHLVGNYYRILISFLTYSINTRPMSIQEFTTTERLHHHVQNIQCYGYKELLLNLATDFCTVNHHLPANVANAILPFMYSTRCLNEKGQFKSSEVSNRYISLLNALWGAEAINRNSFVSSAFAEHFRPLMTTFLNCAQHNSSLISKLGALLCSVYSRLSNGAIDGAALKDFIELQEWILSVYPQMDYKTAGQQRRLTVKQVAGFMIFWGTFKYENQWQYDKLLAIQDTWPAFFVDNHLRPDDPPFNPEFCRKWYQLFIMLPVTYRMELVDTNDLDVECINAIPTAPRQPPSHPAALNHYPLMLLYHCRSTLRTDAKGTHLCTETKSQFVFKPIMDKVIIEKKGTLLLGKWNALFQEEGYVDRINKDLEANSMPPHFPKLPPSRSKKQQT